MKINTLLASLLFASFECAAPLYAADSAKGLVDELNNAIARKDISSATALVDWGKAPSAAYRMFKMNFADCLPPGKCKIELVPLSEEDKKPQTDYAFPAAPEGNIKITSSDDTGNEGFTMPYAKIGNQYRIIIGQQTPESYAQTKASADAKKIASEMDADLFANGTALPADGGDPARAFKEYTSAIVKGDTAYLADHGTAGDRYFFGKSYKEDPVKRSIAIELAQMDNIPAPVIKGGTVKDGRALLLVSGTSAQGWTSEGAVLLMQEGGKWTVEDKSFIGYPAS